MACMYSCKNPYGITLEDRPTGIRRSRYARAMKTYQGRWKSTPLAMACFRKTTEHLEELALQCKDEYNQVITDQLNYLKSNARLVLYSTERDEFAAVNPTDSWPEGYGVIWLHWWKETPSSCGSR